MAKRSLSSWAFLLIIIGLFKEIISGFFASETHHKGYQHER